jgi:hypothetical protein
MRDIIKSYIDGVWVASAFSDVINDMTLAREEIFAQSCLPSPMSL